MARRWKNPLGFSPTSVTLIVSVIYILISALLLYIHHSVPRVPNKAPSKLKVNVTEAWRDLQILTSEFHPYNSHSNDHVRDWLLNRIDNVLSKNIASFDAESGRGWLSDAAKDNTSEPAAVEVFNDLQSNVTFHDPKRLSSKATSVYFEGTNVIVYVRGSKDDTFDWWRNASSAEGRARGVLVNAHYDSVSTGFGATDNGVGVVTLLQLIKHYSSKGNQPSRGLVALFNNGEEDFLNGAWAFMRHPISRFPDTFLNLEGAGAGGRALLLRSTDTEVTRSYKNVPYPFGNSLSADAFNRGVVKSETDYAVFNGQLKLRGLDVAFYEPRARYHTSEDNSRDTSPASIWHMLSAAIATTEGLTSDTSTIFAPGEGTHPAYFDVFGRGFGLLQLHTLVALSITLLVISPIVIFAVLALLHRQDKSYLFARTKETDPLDPNAPDETTTIKFGGWRGLFRYPIAFVLASAAVIGLAFLVSKVNPMIIYSSEYAVWTMMLLAWFLVAWFFLRGSDYMRPSALHRAHAFGWIFFLSWVLLLYTTVLGNSGYLTGGSPMMIFFAGSFVALNISYLEFLALPSKKAYLMTASHEEAQSRTAPSQQRLSRPGSAQGAAPRDDRPGSSNRRRNEVDPEPTETTSLLGRSSRSGFKPASRRTEAEDTETAGGSNPLKSLKRKIPFGEEQGWSGSLPSGLWLLQLLVFAPVVLIFIGQVALLMTTALHQTPADGSPILPIYLVMGVLLILLLVPASPFFHRIPGRIPFILLLVFIGLLIYDLVAFPFSPQSRLKVSFRQDVDLDTGLNTVTLRGVDGYLQKIIKDLPSAAGKSVQCDKKSKPLRQGLRTCSWEGLAPDPLHDLDSAKYPLPPEKRYKNLIEVDAKLSKSKNNTAKIKINTLNSRGCRINFDKPIYDFYVEDAGEQDERMPRVGPNGTQEIRLWSREWDRKWTVHLTWNKTEDGNDISTSKNKSKGMDGTALCFWSDANAKGVIPALDELQLYMPEWSIVTKMDDGLVFGFVRFSI